MLEISLLPTLVRYGALLKLVGPLLLQLFKINFVSNKHFFLSSLVAKTFSPYIFWVVWSVSPPFHFFTHCSFAKLGALSIHTTIQIKYLSRSFRIFHMKRISARDATRGFVERKIDITRHCCPSIVLYNRISPQRKC